MYETTHMKDIDRMITAKASTDLLTSRYFNPGPAGPGYALPLQTV